jgi:anti-sigma factor ChrR (cupin superfamily)
LDNFNIDLNKSIVINTNSITPLSSPSSGVERIPLERDQAESGRTTSIVIFAPNSSFTPHNHPLGEEILVLEGTFSDEFGDYPAGTYLRNPPGSLHAPFSKEGCKIFVKLHQMDSEDTKKIVIDTNREPWRQGHGNLEVMSLHSFKTEGTALVKWPKGEKFIRHQHFGGEEIFVLSGQFIDEHGKYPKGTWIRSPHLSTHHPYVEEETIIFVKTGHLLEKEMK